MRRADRLFQIVQMLRHRRVTTARDIAEELEVSERTIYRDIRDLSLSGIPVMGEAGVGYTLPSSFDLPPLMFTEEEMEALVLGVRMVSSWGDPALGRAAGQVLAKVEVVIPDRLRRKFEDSALFAPPNFIMSLSAEWLEILRTAIRAQRKVHMLYTSVNGVGTERMVRPLCLYFWGSVWTFGAWCELRGDFRHFRLDTIQTLKLSEETFEMEPGKGREDFFRHVAGGTRGGGGEG